MKVIVVIPAFNEEACVAEVVAGVMALGYPCVVVDDCSSDDTAARAREAGATVVRLPVNLNVGGALRAGWRYAITNGFDTVVQVDGDGQHPVDHISALVEELSSRHLDMVVGSRFAQGGSHEGMSIVRRVSIRFLSFALRRRAHVELSDPTSGFRAITGELLYHFAFDFPHYYLGDTFEAALIAGRRRYQIGEIAVPMRARQGGAPSADLKASCRAMARAVGVMMVGASFDIPHRSQNSGRPDSGP